MARYGVWKPYALHGRAVLAYRRGGYTLVAHAKGQMPAPKTVVTLRISRKGSSDYYETTRTFAEWKREPASWWFDDMLQSYRMVERNAMAWEAVRDNPELVANQKLALGTVGSKKLVACRSLSEASDFYRTFVRNEERDGRGGSSTPGGLVYDISGRIPKVIASVSYNGSVWPDRAWKDGDVPLYDPAARRSNPKRPRRGFGASE